MPKLLTFAYRFAAGSLLGAQLFFVLIATRIVFRPEVAALPQGDPRRLWAADTVGQMLGSLDRAALGGCALAVLCAVLLARAGVPRALRAALPPLLAGLCAAASSALVTPAIHSLREAGQTASPQFGRLHGLSSGLLLLELALLLLAVWRAPRAEG